MTAERRNRTTSWPAVIAAYRASTPSAGQLLRAARQAGGLTLRDLSTRTGYAPGYLSAIETGTKRPPLDTLIGIARVLGVDMAALHAACKRDVVAGFERSWEEAL